MYVIVDNVLNDAKVALLLLLTLLLVLVITVDDMLLTLLGGIALAAQAIPPIPTHFSVAWSVCPSSVTLAHPA